jgi:hyperosmotically inducible periplasmic protein
MAPRPLVVSFALSALLFTAQQVSAQSAQYGATSESPMSTSADNSGSNRLDPTNANADAQKNDKADLRLTQTIRKHIMADKSLSMYAHNVKIVAIKAMSP